VKLLAVSSRYPPDDVGGYELACADVMTRLRTRGHEVHVLTSLGQREAPAVPVAGEEQVHRLLDFVPLYQAQVEPIGQRARREWRNQHACRHLIDSFQPDIISLWDMWGLLPSLLTVLSRAGRPVTCAVSSPWMLDYATIPDRWSAFWSAEHSAGPKRWAKHIVGRAWRPLVDLKAPVGGWPSGLRRAFFVSRALKAQHVVAGLASPDAPVIYHGIDPAQFAPGRSPETAGRKLLVAGRVVAEKGIHTAIEALAQLTAEERDLGLTLDIVGPQPEPDYVCALLALVARHGLERVVRFEPKVRRRDMPAVYLAHDVLLFPSVWEEPFSLVLLEAMACGLPVVGTLTGGSPEVLQPEVTGLSFRAGDAGELARQVTRLWTEPGLREALSTHARRLVQRDFTIDRMVEQVERFLSDSRRSRVPGSEL